MTAAASSSAASGLLPRGVAQVSPDAPAAVLMVELSARQVLYANEVASQLAPGLLLPVSVDEWSSAADLRDLDGDPLEETAHPLSRIARFKPVAGQGVSAARGSDLGARREPLWAVALPLDDAPNLRGHALVVFIPVRDREQLQERAHTAHSRTDGAAGAAAPPAAGDAAAVREAAVLATGLSFTVADARTQDMPLVWVNPAFTAVTGYTFDRAVGHNCRFMQGPGTDRETTVRMRTALHAGRSVTETLLNYRADGTAFWNQVAMSPIVDAEGAVTHYVGIQTDVSGRVAADAERERALAAERAARAEAEAAHGRLQLLAEVSTQLSGTTDVQVACTLLAELVVPALGDFAILAVVGDDTALPTAAPSALPAGSAPLTLPTGRHGFHDVAWNHHDPDLRGALGVHAEGRLSAMNEQGRAALASLMVPSTASAISTAGVSGGEEPRPDGKPVERQGRARAAGSTDAVLAVEGSEITLAQPSRQAVAPGRDQAIAAEVAVLLRPGPAREALVELAPTSMATLPLRSRGRTLGLMTIGTGRGRAPLSAEDLALADDIATRAGLALDRARLYRQQRDLAEGLQRSLLHLSPSAAPAHVGVAVRYVAAAEAAQVGGDFYDVFTQPNGAAVVVIGDVMGHDTQAAAAMAQLRSIMRTLGMAGEEHPAQVLSRTDAMMRGSGVDTTATAIIVRLWPADAPSALPGTAAVLEWSNAGHPPPVVIEADGKVRLLESPTTDLLLGIDPAAVRQCNRALLHPGATVLLYTDGLVERRDQPLAAGLSRLQRAAAEAAAHTGRTGRSGDAGRGGDLEALVDAVLERMLPEPSPDDVAVVAVQLS